MIAGPCWNWSVFPAYHLLRQNACWHLNFDKKRVVLFILQRFVVIIFYIRLLPHLQVKWTPSSHSLCTSNSPLVRQQGALESLRLQDQRQTICFQKRHTKSSVHDNSGLQKWKGKPVFSYNPSLQVQVKPVMVISRNWMFISPDASIIF